MTNFVRAIASVRLANNSIGIVYQNTSGVMFQMDSHPAIKIKSTTSQIPSIDICLINGFPAILFLDDQLYYVRATNAIGSTWGVPISLVFPFANSIRLCAQPNSPRSGCHLFHQSNHFCEGFN